jgi:serine/threonine protein kinase
MVLKDRSLESLIVGGCSSATPDLIATTILKHMLQALDFLSLRGIVHRDVKPGNILYQSQTEPEPGQAPYNFLLGDFDLSNRQMLTKTFAGSSLYMAPEICKEVFAISE